MVWAYSALIADTFLRSATISPVRYSAKCQRSGVWANIPPNSSSASSTIVGKAIIPGMNDLSPHPRDVEGGEGLTSPIYSCGGRVRATEILDPKAGNTQVAIVQFLPNRAIVADVLTFIPKNWDTLQTVTVSTYDDNDSFNAWWIVRHYVDGDWTPYWRDLRVLAKGPGFSSRGTLTACGDYE